MLITFLRISKDFNLEEREVKNWKACVLNTEPPTSGEVAAVTVASIGRSATFVQTEIS